jgi:hypothetical protein
MGFSNSADRAQVLFDKNTGACLASVEGHQLIGQPPAIGPQLKAPTHPYIFVPVCHIHHNILLSI